MNTSKEREMNMVQSEPLFTRYVLYRDRWVAMQVNLERVLGPGEEAQVWVANQEAAAVPAILEALEALVDAVGMNPAGRRGKAQEKKGKLDGAWDMAMEALAVARRER